MDQNNQITVSSDSTSLGGKAWTAYIRVSTIAFFLLFLATPIAFSVSKLTGFLVLIIAIAYVVYRVLLVKSHHLYFDDLGVWAFSGILPWSKGVAGVKWRDLDEAVYFQSLGSWLFKSYSLRIGHRFTKSSEILLSHWSRGHEAVMAINEQHQNLVRENRLN
jgi:hypothetical protein